MSNEKADEFLSWRGPLSTPGGVPEQGLDDKELSWQRLAERLEKKPARRGAAWWIAAACFVMALVPATRFFHGGPVHVESRTPTRVPAAPVSARPGSVAVSPSAVPARPAAGGTTGVPAATGPRRPGSAHSPHSNYGEFAAVKTPTVSRIRPIIIDTSMIASLAPSLLAPIAGSNAGTNAGTPGSNARPRPNHALRIVYLNELTDKKGPSLSMAPRQPAFLRLGVATEYSANNNAPIIKIDISSPNH